MNVQEGESCGLKSVIHRVKPLVNVDQKIAFVLQILELFVAGVARIHPQPRGQVLCSGMD